MRCLNNGIRAVKMLDKRTAYFAVQSDRFGCPRCGKTVLVGFAPEPEWPDGHRMLAGPRPQASDDVYFSDISPSDFHFVPSEVLHD